MATRGELTTHSRYCPSCTEDWLPSLNLCGAGYHAQVCSAAAACLNQGITAPTRVLRHTRNLQQQLLDTPAARVVSVITVVRVAGFALTVGRKAVNSELSE